MHIKVRIHVNMRTLVQQMEADTPWRMSSARVPSKEKAPKMFKQHFSH